MCRSPVFLGENAKGTMERKRIGRSSNRLLIPLAVIALTGLGLSVADAQTGSQSQPLRSASIRSAAATSVSGQYYVGFPAWDFTGAGLRLAGRFVACAALDLACLAAFGWVSAMGQNFKFSIEIAQNLDQRRSRRGSHQRAQMENRCCFGNVRNGAG